MLDKRKIGKKVMCPMCHHAFYDLNNSETYCKGCGAKLNLKCTKFMYCNMGLASPKKEQNIELHDDHDHLENQEDAIDLDIVGDDEADIINYDQENVLN